jgi:glycerol-3-phosphate acyltransferase PlsX
MRIGIDIMGGDFAPRKNVHGAILALEFFKNSAEIFLFGKKKIIISELSFFNYPEKKFTIIDCPDVIEMGEHPTKAFKSKPHSSISKGLNYLAENKLDGFSSTGNTGAMLVGGYYAVKAITGVLRPAISSLIPKENGGVTVLLDVGANADCKADVLYQFGLLGSLFSKHICKIKNPKVSLLNLGEESSKGNMLTQATYQMMENNMDYDFIGNIEGRDIFNSNADVIVCDGFTGNIVIKEAEAFYNLVSKRGFKDDFFKRLNYESYGGTPILGLKKPVIIGHGISNEIAIKNMLIMTKNIIQSNLIQNITNTLK